MKGARGRELVSERTHRLPRLLHEQLEAPRPSLPPDLAEHGLIITGVGSSEAAARYACRLFSEQGVSARFCAYAEFYARSVKSVSTPYLMLFTQGLSPNAEIVLSMRDQFRGVILVTSSTVEGQRSAGKGHRADWLEKLVGEGAVLVWHPLENEYEILPRFIGPVCVMAEVCRMVQSVFPEALPDLHLLPALFENVEAPDCSFGTGTGFFFTNSTLHYAQNLSCKVMETLMTCAPFLSDALTYSHGPFQVNCRSAALNVLFTTTEPVEQELTERLLPLFEATGPVQVVTSPVPAPLAVFYYEAFLNRVLEKALTTQEIDLVDWPGKGRDGAGYHIQGPLNP